MTALRSWVDRLHHEASTAAGGLAEFGADGYRVGLDVLLSSVAGSRHAGERLQRRVHASVVSALVSRLSSEAGWSDRPGCLTENVRAPVVIIGLPRCGTTALHQLLSVDPQFQWLPAWLAGHPRPRPPRAEWESNELFRASVADYLAEGVNALHDIRPSDPEECIRVMRQSFCSMTWVSSFPLPAYYEWFAAADERPSYRRYKDNLRLIGSGQPHEPWLLKNPSHTFGLGAMLDVFPDARFVHIYRDPVETIVSGASLVARSWAGDGAGFFSREELGAHRLDVWGTAADRMEVARSRIPIEQIIDVDHRDFAASPHEVMQRIYNYFDLVLSAEVEARMREHVARRPREEHGRHRYSAEEFGLTAGMVRERLGGYIDRYGLAGSSAMCRTCGGRYGRA